MEKEQNNKVVGKESNTHCDTKLKAKCNTNSFSYSKTRLSTYLDPSGMPSNKPSHIHSIGLSCHPCSSTSVAMGVNPINFPSITTTTHGQRDYSIKKQYHHKIDTEEE